MDWKDQIKRTGSNLLDGAKNTYSKAKVYRDKSAQERKIRVDYDGVIRKTAETIRQDVEGYYYLSPMYNEEAERFTFETVEFEGSTVIAKTETKGEQKGRAGSALVGGLIAGPVGAAVGGSRKRKHKEKSKTVQEEKPGKGNIFLRSVETGEIKKVAFTATQQQFENIRLFFT